VCLFAGGGGRRRCRESGGNVYPDAYADADPDANTDAYPHTDAYAYSHANGHALRISTMYAVAAFFGEQTAVNPVSDIGG